MQYQYRRFVMSKSIAYDVKNKYEEKKDLEIMNQ